MEKERPPGPENQDFNTSSTDDKIQAYEAVVNAYNAGTQPAVFLTHSFLQDNPILLEEGCLSVNWVRIPGLYSRTDQMLTVSITCSVGQMGAARRMDLVGTRHPAQTLSSQLGCGIMQGHI